MAVNLHDLACVLAAPTCVVSAADGDIRDGVGGALHADVRVLSRCELLVGGVRPTLLTHHEGSTEAAFVSVVSAPGYSDVTVRLDRRRRINPGRIEEEVWITTASPDPCTIDVTYLLESDMAPVTAMRERTTSGGGSFADVRNGEGHDGDVRWAAGRTGCVLRTDAAIVRRSGPNTLALTWAPRVSSGKGRRIAWVLEIDDADSAVIAATTPGLDVAATTDRILAGRSSAAARAWLHRSLEDLNALRMALPGDEPDAFFAAGAPWFLTLFGRDSLWTARLLMRADLSHAASTLRIQARLQAKTVDSSISAEPGKIMHELRREVLDLGDRTIPPLYYGTVDATALWVCLLHEAWQAGLAEDQVRALLPALRAALGWITEDADADGDGFAEYADSGQGLANQCWKDSTDAIRFADGRLARGPIASCEVQAYAYQAAVGGAEVLDAFGEDGARYRVWARELRTRFRDRFWCGEGEHRYPALALDGNKKRVDSTTSNIGHLIGTGLLDEAEESLVTDRLLRSDMFSGLGLRTMSSDDDGYWPLSYHCGAVWPHDTAITIWGMLRAGHTEAAATLAHGLLTAAEQCHFRLPELFSGDPAMVPYPTACRPQAWSAAAAVVAVTALPVPGD